MTQFNESQPVMPTDAQGKPLAERLVGRRNVVTGMAALGAAGVLGATRAMAQDDPDEDDVLLEPDDDVLEMAPEISEAYQNFVAKLSSNLGQTDVAVVDTAIRDALVAMVEERFTAGEISRNLADELIERIQTGEAPLAVALFAGMHRRRFERRKNRRDDQDDDSDDVGSDDSTAPTSEATPSI